MSSIPQDTSGRDSTLESTNTDDDSKNSHKGASSIASGGSQLSTASRSSGKENTNAVNEDRPPPTTISSSFLAELPPRDAFRTRRNHYSPPTVYQRLRRVKSERISRTPTSPRFFSTNGVDEDANDGSSSLHAPSVFSGLTELHRNVQQLRTSERDNRFLKSFTEIDLETIDQLGRNHNRSLEERKRQEEARAMAVRQNMLISVSNMLVVQFVGIVVLIFRGGLTVPDAILFSLYTTTTAGFGSVDIPFDTGFLVFVIIYMFVTLASLVSLVAAVYMYLAIQSSVVKKSQDQLVPLRLQKQGHDEQTKTAETIVADPELAALSNSNADILEPAPTNRIWMVRFLLKIVAIGKSIYRKNEFGRVVIVVLYLGSLLLIGTIGMMFLENWTFTEGLYFATFVMTTVGYGDYAPNNQSGTWFVIFWICSNVSFVSIYMGNLSRHYRMFCKANTDRIYKKMHQKYMDVRNDNDSQEAVVHTAGMEDVNKANINNGVLSSYEPRIQTFRDVYRFVLKNAVVTSLDREQLENSTSKDMADLMSFKSVYSSKIFEGNREVMPSFVLLVLVQERVANIIAHDVAGRQSDVVAKDTKLIVSFGDILETSRKWLVPRAAEEAFCYAAFEAIIYVGECRLVNLGADALLSLPPSDVLDILSPFLAALADNANMASWLARTEELASLQFPRSSPF